MHKVKNEVKHAAHSSCRCENHVVFAPKMIYKELREEIIEIFKKLCRQIIQGKTYPPTVLYQWKKPDGTQLPSGFQL